MIRRIWKDFSRFWEVDRGLTVFLVLLVVGTFVVPVVIGDRPGMRFVGDVVLSLLLVTGAWAVSRKRSTAIERGRWLLLQSRLSMSPSGEPRAGPAASPLAPALCDRRLHRPAEERAPGAPEARRGPEAPPHQRPAQRQPGHETKGGHSDAIPLHPEAVPFLAHAIEHSPSELVFPGPDGGMLRPDVRLQALLRRAMARAGIVTGYQHVCRRRGCKHREEAPEATARRCPEHGVKLWPKPRVRDFRFHDLRHTTATLLLTAGVSLVVVSKVMRHRDANLTLHRYGHLVPDYLQAEISSMRLLAEAEVAELAVPLVAAAARTADPRQTIRAQEEAPEPRGISPATPAALAARDTGFEPVAFGSGGQRSIHLS